MKTNLIAVYDRVTKQYSNVMCPRSIDRIQQEFDDVCKNPDSQYHKTLPIMKCITLVYLTIHLNMIPTLKTNYSLDPT